MWDNQFSRGVIKIEAILRFEKSTGLPRNEWITNMYLDEKNRKIYALIDTKILVNSNFYHYLVNLAKTYILFNYILEI
ncbi:hypothetical protein HK098_006443 [Nowakowskiella sp. JEL0407]|nr:hypothetical protein HK098_006443 [Nowakowskiella sp. JEL0407]